MNILFCCTFCNHLLLLLFQKPCLFLRENIFSTSFLKLNKFFIYFNSTFFQLFIAAIFSDTLSISTWKYCFFVLQIQYLLFCIFFNFSPIIVFWISDQESCHFSIFSIIMFFYLLTFELLCLVYFIIFNINLIASLFCLSIFIYFVSYFANYFFSFSIYL